MISHGVFGFKNVFDLYISVSAQDPVTGMMTDTYEYQRSGVGLIVPGAQGAVYLSSKEALPRRSALRGVKDKNGVNIFAVDGYSYDMYVIEVTPQYDAFGSVIGWKHLLKPQIKKTSDDTYNLAESLAANNVLA